MNSELGLECAESAKQATLMTEETM